MRIAIDFDQTIHDQDHPLEGSRMGPPMEGAVEALKILSDLGNELVIFTVRGADHTKGHVEEWLDHYDIPYSYVTNQKENFDLIIDDRAYRYTNWPNVLVHIVPPEPYV